MRTPMPEPNYLQKVGRVVFLVAYLEGMLMFDIPRLQRFLPPPLNFFTAPGMKMSAMTTRDLGNYLVAHAPECTDRRVAKYLGTGGTVLLEIAPLRNGMLHARPGEDGNDPAHPMRLIRWRIDERRPENSESFVISDGWLNNLIERIDGVVGELSAIRPPNGY